jgi:hypothetical protein
VEIQIREQIETMRRMSTTQLREKYREVFGAESRSNHKQFLFRRIAWRIPALTEGGLSEKARQRAHEIANDADLRIRAPKGFEVGTPSGRRVSLKIAASDPRLPCPGTLLVREYQGRTVVAKVRVDGFEYDGRIFRSLSSIAQAVTGTKWNGFVFFNLQPGVKREER